MLLDDLYDYKNQLMRDLCENEEIVRLVTKSSDAPVPNYDLPYRQIFPYEYIPETVDDAKSFICFDVDVTYVPNKTIYIPAIYVWVFTHTSNLRMPDGSGIRIDRLASAVDHVLNGSRIYGMGELELNTVTRFAPIQNYIGRVLAYTAREWNRTAANRKATPRNRKNHD